MCSYEVLCVRTWRWTSVAMKYCVLGPGGGHV